jgi:mono/diheme cytochrome c family protein
MAGFTQTKLWKIGGSVLLLLAGLSLFVYSGAYNVAADEPHWPLTHQLLQKVRDRSIASRSAGIALPNLADKDLIALGAEHYREMCTGCHLAPGIDDTEMRAGLYPLPPSLAKTSRRPQEQFWIIKHGLKMSGMPAWGATHDDEAIWGMVAFLRQLPGLDAAEYAALTGAADGSNHEQGDHQQRKAVGPIAPVAAPNSTHVHQDGAVHTHRGEATSQTKPTS